MKIGRWVIALAPGWCALAAVLMGQPAAAQYEADKVALYSHLSLQDFNASAAKDCWGYVSPSGREYALVCLSTGTAFVEITDPKNPVIIGHVAHQVESKDVKVYQHYVYVSTDRGPLQIIDMDDIDNGNVRLVKTISRGTHNLVINEDSAFLYLAGGGRMVAMDLLDPVNPVEVGRWNGESHDAQVVTYTEGPYAGREIAFVFAGWSNTLDIVDVTDKRNMVLLGRKGYPGAGYTHQGWLSEDRKYLYMDDELDEINRSVPTTRTLVWDVTDLSDPVLVNEVTNESTATDHNLYVRGRFMYQANYRSGFRIWDLANPDKPVEVGYFDTYPADNKPGYDGGAWTAYPFFPSNTVIVSDKQGGLFILDPREALGGGIPCRDVRKLRGRCKSNGKAIVKVKLRNDRHDGERVVINLSGGRFKVEINGRKAKLKHCCFNASFTATLEDPPGCVEPIQRTCE